MSKKYYNIEFVRFIFSLLIVYYHILHSNIMNYTNGNSIYQILADYSCYAGFIVECFLILGGYFLFNTFVKKPDLDWKHFAFNKIARLWPVLAFSIIIGIIFFHSKIYPSIFNILFLQCIGISLEYKGITWYVSPFFWGTLFYFALLKSIRFNLANLLIAIITYFSYVININYCDGGFGRGVIYQIIDLSLLRVLGGLGLGYLLGLFISVLPPTNILENIHSKHTTFIQTVIFSIAEIGTLIFLLLYFMYSKIAYKNHFIIVIAFIILLYCLIQGHGIMSQALNTLKVMGSLGKYAYSIYIMQQTAFYILQKSLWKSTVFVTSHVFLCIGISIIFCVIIGMLTYHLVEYPVYNLFYQKYMVFNKHH